MKRFTKDERGITLLQTLVYVVLFIVLFTTSSSMFIDYNNASNISKEKLLFNKDKTELFNIIQADSSNINTPTISIVQATTGIGNKLQYTVNDDTSTTADDSVKVEIIQSENGLVMKRYSPSSSVSPNDLKSFSFESITKTEFYKIDNICTEDTLATGCVQVSNLYDIVVYNEKKINRRNTMNRAKRSFYFNE